MRAGMQPRERWIAALDSKPVDRFPFWPKLNGAYAQAQAAPFAAMEVNGLHDWIGSDKHGSIARCIRESRSKTSHEVQDQGTTRCEILHTPHGSLTRIQQFDAPSQSWHPTKMPVQSLEDIRILRAWHADVSVEFSKEALDQSEEQRKQIGDSAVVTSSLGTTALMDWMEHYAGIENGHYFLADYPDEVEALFEAMARIVRQRAEIILAHTRADMFYMMENTSTTLISPAQYRQYCFKQIQEVGDIAAANGKRIVLHMCGLLKDLLPDLEKLRVSAFEAFTSPPVGNTTLVEGRRVCPGKCLIGGTNAILWTRSAEKIIQELKEHLDALPHHRGLVITSAGVMPPLASPETIREVARWIQRYPARWEG